MAAAMFSIAASRALLLATIQLVCAHAEVVHFEGKPVPPPYTLEGSYLFYAYSAADAPFGGNGPASVAFKDLKLSGNTSGKQSVVHVGVLPFRDLHKLVNASALCQFSPGAGVAELALKETPAKNLCAIHHVGRFAESFHVLEETAVYMLFVVNCGPTSEGVTLAGSVEVRSPHGLLPGNALGSIRLYTWLLISYVVVLVLWGAKLCCNCASVWTPHLALLVFAAFGVAEVALRYVSLQHTNATGSFEPWESLARTLFVTLQAVFMGFFLHLGAGLGLTTTQVSLKDACLIGFYVLVYAIAGLVQASVYAERHRRGIHGREVMAATAPAASVSTLLYCVVLRRFAALLRGHKDATEKALVQMIQRMTVVATFGLFAASFALGAQLADEPGQSPDWWSYHILSADGLPHVLFLLSLLMVMCIWQPGASWAPDICSHEFRMVTQAPPKSAGAMEVRSLFTVEEGEGPGDPAPARLGAPAPAE